MSMSDTRKHTAPITVLLTAEAKTEVEKRAATKGIPVSTMLRIVITEWLAASTNDKKES
jgi:predicted DNA binding CopG/RHH family protein